MITHTNKQKKVREMKKKMSEGVSKWMANYWFVPSNFQFTTFLFCFVFIVLKTRLQQLAFSQVIKPQKSI